MHEGSSELPTLDDPPIRADSSLPPHTNHNKYRLAAFKVTKKSDKMPILSSFQEKEDTEHKPKQTATKTQIDWKIVHKPNITQNQTFLEYFFQSMAGYSEGKTKTNQDSVYFNVDLHSATNTSLFGVFDGHGVLGHKVSDFLKKNITGRVLD